MRTTRIFIIIHCIILALWSLGCSEKKPPKGALSVPQWHGQLKIDGVLDEAGWKNATQITLRRSDGGADAMQSTVVLISRNVKDLLLAFRCRDEDVFSPYKNRDDPLYLHEAVEVFLDPDEDQKDYMEFEVSPAGVRFDASFTGHRQGMDLGFNPASRLAVKVDGTMNKRDDKDQGYAIEFAIPFSQMVGRGRRPPAAGDCWRANFFRLDKSHNRFEASSWRPTRGDFHDLAAFGQICF